MLSFGQIFQCPLVNTTVTSFSLPIDTTKVSRILLLSDTHLGADRQLKQGLESYMAALQELCTAENPTHICHLGDLIDGTVPNGSAVLGIVLKRMSSLKIPTWAIGGNHDREFFASLKMEKDPYVTPLSHFAMCIDKSPERVFLAHDIGNNYRVRDQFAYSFVTWVKDGCSKQITPNDWLVIGHTHTGLVSPTSRVACVGQFSPPIGAFGYAILEIRPDGVSVNTKYMIGRE